MEGLRKYTIPIVGVLSSGKSTFINGIFLNSTILEVGMAHTTKFICIIRHQSELANGKYKFTKVKINSKSLLKDGDTIEDKTAIKNKIIEINKKEISSKDILNDFYLFELNIHLINDKKLNDELLKDIDFMDIPGLDFFEAKKNNSNENSNEIESKKIVNIFKNFKDKLKYFIIIFDCLRLHHESSFTILEKIKNEFNIGMENNLIVINKINLMPEKTIDEIKEYFIKELLKKPDIINHNKNIILPLNAEKILLQQQYKINFKLFVKYLYNLFCEYTLKKEPSEDNYFIDYINKYIDKKKEELKIDNIDINNITNYEEEIKPALEQIYTNNYHSEQIKNINVENKEEFFNDVNKDFFYQLYSLFSNNQIEYDLMEYNEAKQKIINYLKIIQNNKEDKEEKKIKDNIKEKKNENLLFIQNLDEFMNSNILTQIELNNNKNTEFYKILKEMNKRKNLIVNAFLNTQFRISVVGLSSVGKSYIINCLIGKEILETGSGETTQFGLIIENQDSDEVSLCRAKYKYIYDENGKEYLIFEEDKNSFVNGFDNVKKHLLLLNKNQIHQEKDNIQDNKNLFKFWILKIRITMCQFKDFNIQIIDFPGLGTSIKYIETDIFKNLLSTSNIIFHVVDYYKIGETDREISNRINKYINDYRLDPYFGNKNTLYLLNKLNPLVKNEANYEDKISEIFGYKKELIDFIKINNKFYDDLIEVTNFTFINYLKKNYDKYQKRYKTKYSDFVMFFNAFNKIKDNKEKILNIHNDQQIIKDKAIEEFDYFLSKNNKEEYEKMICEYINKNENFKNNILNVYIEEKNKNDKNGILEKIDKLNNYIIEKFGYNRYYFNEIIKDFILNIDRLLQNILNSRSIPKEDLDNIQNQFKNEIENKYKLLSEEYSKNFDKLKQLLKDKVEELKNFDYKTFLSIEKSKIREDIQKFTTKTINDYNIINKNYFSLIIQRELYESLKKIIINYEEKRNSNKRGKKMELSEFKKFIKDNIRVIENENIELENVRNEEGVDCCGYSKEKKNKYLDKIYEDELNNLKKYFNILIENSKKQKNKSINEYLIKLSTSFGEYNQEEKNNINSIKIELNSIINKLFKDINDYHLYAQKSFENGENIFKNEMNRIKPVSKEGFGFKKMNICIYPGKNIILRGISIKIYKESNPDLSTPFITIVFPPKNINLIEKITSCLIDIETFKKEKIFVISKEKNIERVKMRINFTRNLKYFNWIEMLTDVFNNFSLFKFEFLSPIMLNQPLDNKALYYILESFLLIQIQGDIPIFKIFEFLRIENIITKLAEELIPDYILILLKILTSIEFSLNTSIEEIRYEFFKSYIKLETNQNDYLKMSFQELIHAFLGIPKAFIDCEDVEINFRLFRNNIKILLNLPVQHHYLLGYN